MQNPLPAALYVLTQMVDDWAGEGPAMIHWAARRQEALLPPGAMAVLVAGEALLSPDQRLSLEVATRRFFTPEEAEDLGALLVQQPFAGKQSLHYGRADLPISPEALFAMQESNPLGVSKLWRIRPPDPILDGHPVPCEGIVSLWPWPGLTPDDVVSLVNLREKLDQDALPPANSAAAG